MGKTAQILQSLARLIGRNSPALSELKTSRSLLTVFASFIVADKKIAADEIAISFDFVRNAFPDANHAQLGDFLEQAIADRPILSPHLQLLKRSLTKEQKIAFALQLFALIKTEQSDEIPKNSFFEVTTAIGIQKMGEDRGPRNERHHAPPSKGPRTYRFLNGARGRGQT